MSENINDVMKELLIELTCVGQDIQLLNNLKIKTAIFLSKNYKDWMNKQDFIRLKNVLENKV